MYIDTHTHLNFSQYDTDRAMVIGNAKKAGVKQYVVPGVDRHSCQTAVHFAREHPGVIFASVGYHPYEATKSRDLTYIESLLKDPQSRKCIVAVGECGLDYHQYKGEEASGRKDVQRRLFENQIVLAQKYNLPMILHSRDAFDDMFAILHALPQIPSGVFHCFSGSLQDLRAVRDMNLYVGIDGNVTYSKQLALTVPHIPLSMLLLETDAPYLTPVPHRGERNEPKYIPLIAQKIAELMGKPVAEVMEATTANAKKLFGI